MRLLIVLVVAGERPLRLMSKVVAALMLVEVGLYEVHDHYPLNSSSVQFDLVVHYALDVVVDYFDLVYFDRLVRNKQDSY